jgi:hypothetical protein
VRQLEELFEALEDLDPKWTLERSPEGELILRTGLVVSNGEFLLAEANQMKEK